MFNWRREPVWSLQQTADAVYESVLRDRGYRRSGTTFRRSDFLHREIRIDEPEAGKSRTFGVACDVKWVGLPDAAGMWAPKNDQLAARPRMLFPRPRVDGGELDGDFLKTMRESLLPFVDGPQAPGELIDTLLEHRRFVNDPALITFWGAVPNVRFAAWGAVVLGDVERCARAIAIESELTAGSPEDEKWSGYFREAVDLTWLSLRGVPRPAQV